MLNKQASPRKPLLHHSAFNPLTQYPLQTLSGGVGLQSGAQDAVPEGPQAVQMHPGTAPALRRSPGRSLVNLGGRLARRDGSRSLLTPADVIVVLVATQDAGSR